MTRDELYQRNPPPAWYQVWVIILNIIVWTVVLTLGWQVILLLA